MTGKRVNRTEQLRAEGGGQTHRSAHVSEAGGGRTRPVRGHQGHGEGGGCFGPTHPSGTSRSMRTEKKPLDLPIRRSQVTLHHAFAGVTVSVQQCPSPPSPQAQPLPREVGLTDETAPSFLSSTRPQTPWFSACAICLCTCHRVALQMCLSVISLPCAGSLLSRHTRLSVSVGDSD